MPERDSQVNIVVKSNNKMQLQQSWDLAVDNIYRRWAILTNTVIYKIMKQEIDIGA